MTIIIKLVFKSWERYSNEKDFNETYLIAAAVTFQPSGKSDTTCQEENGVENVDDNHDNRME